MDKKQDKRKSNIANIKEQLSQGKTTALQDGVFIFHGPLTISEFAELKKRLHKLLLIILKWEKWKPLTLH